MYFEYGPSSALGPGPELYTASQYFVPEVIAKGVMVTEFQPVTAVCATVSTSRLPGAFTLSSYTPMAKNPLPAANLEVSFVRVSLLEAVKETKITTPFEKVSLSSSALCPAMKVQTVGTAVAVAVGGTGVAVGGTGVEVGGTGVKVAGTGVAVEAAGEEGLPEHPEMTAMRERTERQMSRDVFVFMKDLLLES